jgi:hypothetical protein
MRFGNFFAIMKVSISFSIECAAIEGFPTASWPADYGLFVCGKLWGISPRGVEIACFPEAVSK